MKIVALTLFGTVAATAASAQGLPACSGKYEIIRTDAIKPGKLDEFKKAVVDQQAWYKARGSSDKVLLAQVVKEDINGTFAFASDQAITIHIEDTTKAMAPVDDAWKAVRAEYNDSTVNAPVTNSTTVCLLEPTS